MRPSWNDYFLALARTAASRATCPRKSVGAVLTRDAVVLGLGYNGSPSGAEHCIDVGCLMQDGHCIRCSHAEANAVAQAARNGVRLERSTCYVTAKPCWPCLRLLANAGVQVVYFGEDYGETTYPVKLAVTVLRHEPHAPTP